MATIQEEIIYTTPDEMFRVIRKDGLYFPQERVCNAPAYPGGRLFDMSLVRELEANDWTVNIGGWRGWSLGESTTGPYRVSKGDKRYKTEKAAKAYVDNLYEFYHEVA